MGGKRKQLNIMSLRQRRDAQTENRIDTCNVDSSPNQQDNIDLGSPQLLRASTSQLRPTPTPTPTPDIDADTNVHSSNSESEDDVRRGHTLMQDIWNQDPNKLIVVTFNERNQPIGVESSTLASFVGVVGRNTSLAPQGYSDWRLVPIEYKKMCMAEIKKRFAIPKRGENFVLGQVGRVVKDFRGELKAIYMMYKHNRKKLIEEKDPRVPEDQWLKLISYWDQDKTKKRAATNQINQKNKTMPHCAGRKSFACISAEEKEKKGVEPTRGELFIKTHKPRKDGKPIDEESDRVVKAIQKKLDELPDGKEPSQGLVAWEGDLYSQVIKEKKRPGKIRGVGRGVCPTSLWGLTATSHNVEDENDKVKNLEDRLCKIQENNDKQIRVIEQNNAEQMRVMQEKHNAELKKLKEDQVRELKKVKFDQARIEAQLDKLTGYLVKQSRGNAR